jgi:hypothetical protein
MMKKPTLGIWVGASALILAALIGLIGTLITSTPIKKMSGEIESPKESSVVSSVFDVTGRLDNIPDKYHVWLMVKIGDNIWPKTELNRNDRRWVKQVHEYGSSDKFVLTLVVVDKESHHKIIVWKTNIEKGDTKDWTPNKNIEYITTLDVVQLNLKTE